MDIPDDLLGRVMDLGAAEREELLRLLILSLGPGGPDRDSGYEEAWAAEIAERVRKFETGETEAIPMEEAMQRLHDALKGAHSS